VPSSLCHLKIDREEKEKKEKLDLNIVDSYQFPRGYLGTSAQFVPRPEAKKQTDGYIVCVVLTSDEFLSEPKDESAPQDWSQNSEIWIFDAQNLQQGALYKLSHPKLNFGFTVHTTWLKEAVSPSPRKYNIREDYDYLIDGQPPELRERIRQLFEEEIYPNFE
ncbi:MAG: carotenoid oxygenase family protein, partial [Xenococcaceae cyanobacterium]